MKKTELQQKKQILLDYKEWYENKYVGECIVELYYINQYLNEINH